MDAPKWVEAGACRAIVIPELDPWHPPIEASESYRRQAFAWARQMCLSCPVQVNCTRYGLRLLEIDGAVAGMYGGLTPRRLSKLARSIVRSARKVAQHGTRACYVKGCRCHGCRTANARSEAHRRLWAGRGKA